MRRLFMLAVLVLMTPNVVSALVQAYSVVPVKAVWSGLADPEDGVSQTLTCNFDSLVYVELFCGEQGAGGTYDCEVHDGQTGARVAHRRGVVPGQACNWLAFKDFTVMGTFTKGKVYEFRFTRAGTDSINYFWQDGDPYRYGDIVVGSESIPGRDLCLRVYGTLNPAPPAFWGMDECSLIPSVSAA